MKHLKPFKIFETIREVLDPSEVVKDMKVSIEIKGKYQEWIVNEVFKTYEDLVAANKRFPIEHNYILRHENFERLEKNIQYILNNKEKFKNEAFLIVVRYDPPEISQYDSEGGLSAEIVVYGKNDINFSDNKEIYVSKFLSNLSKTGLFESSIYRDVLNPSELESGMKLLVKLDGKYSEWFIDSIFRNLKELKDFVVLDVVDDQYQIEKMNYFIKNSKRYDNKCFLILKNIDEHRDVSLQLVVYGKDEMNFSDDKEIYVSKSLTNLNKTGIFD